MFGVRYCEWDWTFWVVCFSLDLMSLDAEVGPFYEKSFPSCLKMYFVPI